MIRTHMTSSRLRRTAVLLALTVLAACADGDAGKAGEGSGTDRSTGVGVLGMKPGMTRTEYMALPDSARLDDAQFEQSFDTERGVGVEVDITLEGQQGDSIPLAYSLHDARNDVHFLSRTVAVVPDAPRWRRHGH